MDMFDYMMKKGKMQKRGPPRPPSAARIRAQSAGLRRQSANSQAEKASAARFRPASAPHHSSGVRFEGVEESPKETKKATGPRRTQSAAVSRLGIKKATNSRPASAPVKNEERISTQQQAWENFKPTVPAKEIKARDFTKDDNHEWQVRKLCREKADTDYRQTLVDERKKEESDKRANFEARKQRTNSRQRPESAMDGSRNSTNRPKGEAKSKHRPASAPLRAQATGNQSTGRTNGEEIIYESSKSMARDVQSARRHRPEEEPKTTQKARRAWSAPGTRAETTTRREQVGGGNSNRGKENVRIQRPGTAKKVTDPFHPEAMTKQFQKQQERRNACIRGFKKGTHEYAGSNGGLQDVAEEQMSELDAFEKRFEENMAIPNEQRDYHWRQVDSGTRKIRPDGTIDWT
jgi:hypothetical protein